MRVLFDNNVFVSMLMQSRGNPARAIGAWLDGFVEGCTSEALIAELKSTLTRTRVRNRLPATPDEIDALLGALARVIVDVPAELRLDAVPRDPDDNLVLEAAVAGQADVIVTGDADLLDLRRYEGIEIMTPAAFVRMMASPGAR